MKTKYNNIKVSVYRTKDLVSLRDAHTVFRVRLYEKEDKNPDTVKTVRGTTLAFPYGEIYDEFIFSFFDEDDTEKHTKIARDMARIIETQTPLQSDYRKYDGRHCGLGGDGKNRPLCQSKNRPLLDASDVLAEQAKQFVEQYKNNMI